MKEKEEAHREYKQAIEQGHGAYLLDEGTRKKAEGGGEGGSESAVVRNGRFVFLF